MDTVKKCFEGDFLGFCSILTNNHTQRSAKKQPATSMARPRAV
jgi:hypothetical protein